MLLTLSYMVLSLFRLVDGCISKSVDRCTMRISAKIDGRFLSSCDLFSLLILVYRMFIFFCWCDLIRFAVDLFCMFVP